MTTDQDIRNQVKEFRPISQKVDLFDPNISDKSTRLYKFKDSKENSFKIWIFTDRIKLESPVTTSLLFSINFPDQVCLANKQLKEINGIGKVFTDNSKDDQIQHCIKLLSNELSSLNFHSNEGLTVYGNSLQLILKKERNLLTEIETCKRIKSILEFNYPDNISAISYTDLPDGLRLIVEKFENLTITYDFERDEKIQKLTKIQRANLIKAVEPKLAEINSYLDTFGDKPLTEGAIGLQSLAELVIEVTNEQEKKNHR